MERVCWTMRVRPEKLDEYRARHRDVWPEMLAALNDAGWGNYSLFLTDDGLLIGYLETEDFAAAQAAMEATDVNARWQSEMAEFLDAAAAPASKRCSTLSDFAAVDLGAESGRVVRGRLGGGRVELEVVHRFANRPVRLPDGLRWNLLALFGEALDGLRKLAATSPLRGIGVDSWGVDYALLDGARARPRAAVPLPRRAHRRHGRRARTRA